MSTDVMNYKIKNHNCTSPLHSKLEKTTLTTATKINRICVKVQKGVTGRISVVW